MGRWGSRVLNFRWSFGFTCLYCILGNFGLFFLSVKVLNVRVGGWVEKKSFTNIDQNQSKSLVKKSVSEEPWMIWFMKLKNIYCRHFCLKKQQTKPPLCKPNPARQILASRHICIGLDFHKWNIDIYPRYNSIK